MRNLAVIPARSGSKGLKDKNIKALNGKPLLAYTIEAAKGAGIFDEIFVSTDSVEYARIAREWGASVPFMRSGELATDSASSWDVVREAVTNYSALGMDFDSVALLQPTSPLRRSEDILKGYAAMEAKKAKAVVAVCEMDHSPLWSNTLPADLSLADFLNADLAQTPRQSLPVYYRINGALYMIDKNHLMSGEPIYQDGCYAVIMPKERSVDIDDWLDFKYAEVLIASSEAQ